MIYPKNRSSVIGNSSHRIKRDFLNPFQREELKKRLTEKFTKKHGKKNPEIVKEKVENFFQKTCKINAANLKILEREISKAGAQKRGEQSVKEPSVQPVPEPVQSGGQAQNIEVSNPYLSGEPTMKNTAKPIGYNPSLKAVQSASNLPQIRSARTPKPETFKLPRLGSKSKSRRVLGTVDLAGIHQVTSEMLGKPVKMTEKARWNAISKYNFYVYKQNQKMEKIRKRDKMRKAKNLLDEQVRQKERRKQRKYEELQSYRQAQQKILNIEHQKDENQKKLKKDKIKFEKEMRDLQLKETQDRKRFEMEQEKTLNSYILGKIQKELKEEQADKIIKKRVKMENMKKMLVENEQRKQVLVDQQEKERLEDIDLQKKAIVISENLEKQRADDFRNKANRINALIVSSKDKVNEIKNKGLNMEVRNRRYQELRNIAVKKKQERQMVLGEQRKKDLRNFLARQVDEKKKREDMEKGRCNDQADIWKKEQADFDMFTDNQQKNKKILNKKYQDDLLTQIRLKEQRLTDEKDAMTNEEAAMNKILLGKLGDVRLLEEGVEPEDPVSHKPGDNNIF